VVSTADEQSHVLDYRIGSTVMEVIRDAGIDNRVDGSRLSCQIRLTEELSGQILTIPEQE
jgi:ferredoxin